MNKVERLKFMQKRFGRPKGMFAAKPKLQDGPKRSYRFDAFGVPQRLSELRQKWVYMPEPKPALRIAPNRKERISPLAQIAKEWRRGPIPRSLTPET